MRCIPYYDREYEIECPSCNSLIYYKMDDVIEEEHEYIPQQPTRRATMFDIKKTTVEKYIYCECCKHKIEIKGKGEK